MSNGFCLAFEGKKGHILPKSKVEAEIRCRGGHRRTSDRIAGMLKIRAANFFFAAVDFRVASDGEKRTWSYYLSG